MDFRSETDIPSLDGKVILITGGTDGLGKASVRALALHSPAHIYLTARNQAKAEQMLAELKEQHPNHAPITVLEMNLTSLASVKAAAARFLAENTRLDILMCNAGIMSIPALTKDGYEITFGVNHLGHALLIQLLLPLLQQTATEPDSDVRIVNLSSIAEKMAPKHYTFDKMKTELPQLGKMTRYAQSKLANIHYTMLLAQKYPEITCVSVHPGTVRTNFTTGFYDGMSKTLIWALAKVGPYIMDLTTADEGARGQLWCSVAKKESVKTGAYYCPVGVSGKESKRARDVKMAQALWDWTDEQLKPYY